MNPNKPHKIILYPSGRDPMVFEGDQALGVAMDPNLGPGVLVLNAEGERMTVFGMAFALVQRESAIEMPTRSPLIKG